MELSKDFQCVCKSGFTGERYEFTDYCASSPCKNGGNCTSNILGHVCHCVSGFTGPYCEVTLNACDTNPCKHGVCILQGASHKCVCESGFSGPTCDQPNSSQMTTTQVTYPDPCIASASVCNEPAKCKAVGPQDLSAFVRKRIKQEIVLYRITTRNTGFAVLRIRVRVTQLYVE